MTEQAAPTRTDKFEARLKRRYAAERRFKMAGLGAVLFSVGVLLFLLVTMSINGIGGFQRAELSVPIDFTQAGLSAAPAGLSQPSAVQSLQAQGLPQVVEYFAEESLGKAGADQLSDNAWRTVADQIITTRQSCAAQKNSRLPQAQNWRAVWAAKAPPKCNLLPQIWPAKASLKTG